MVSRLRLLVLRRSFCSLQMFIGGVSSDCTIFGLYSLCTAMSGILNAEVG